MSKLSTARLELRVRALGDSDGLLALYSDPDVGMYMGGAITDRDKIVKAVFTSDSHWRKNGYGLWSVFLKTSGKLIGTCGLQLTISSETELLCHIAKTHWKKGYATEACQAVIKYGFEIHKLNQIVALSDGKNLAAIKVLEKLGFKHGGKQYILTKRVSP